MELILIWLFRYIPPPVAVRSHRSKGMCVHFNAISFLFILSELTFFCFYCKVYNTIQTTADIKLATYTERLFREHVCSAHRSWQIILSSYNRFAEYIYSIIFTPQTSSRAIESNTTCITHGTHLNRSDNSSGVCVCIFGVVSHSLYRSLCSSIPHSPYYKAQCKD